MSFHNRVLQLAGWLRGSHAADSPRSSGVSSASFARDRMSARRGLKKVLAGKRSSRAPVLELMEPRLLMAADPIQIGAVYVEEDMGSDLHGDLFYITFQGGAPDTRLTELTIDGDLNQDGFGIGDVFFDTSEEGLGAEGAFAFQIEELITADPNAAVRADVEDGSTKLTLRFSNFKAGDRLVFSIDVDEVQFLDPNETDLDRINENFDPITSGIEFQNSWLIGSFEAPHYEIAEGQDRFLNRYDSWLDETGLPLPRDNADGKRDRSAGAGFELQQIPKPVSVAGTVYVDANEDLIVQPSEQPLEGVRLELFRLTGGDYVSTGHTTVTDALGNYRFGTELGLGPGTYQVRQTQPDGFYSVGAAIGLVGSTPVGQLTGNPDVITNIELPLGDLHATDLNFAENLPSSISGNVCVVLNGFDCFSATSEKGPLAGVTLQLRDAQGELVATDVTAEDGSYQFVGLRAGIYSITQVTPDGVLDGSARSGSAGGQVVDPNHISQIVLAGGVTAVDYDFCELTPSDLSGHTYFDTNNNGVREAGERPLANVLITLWDEAGKRVAETRTNANGSYRFDNLRPGTYRLTEETPAGYLPGRAAIGTVRGVRVGTADSTGDVLSSIVLPAGSSGIDYDFGEILPGSISGRVIADVNGNCIIDAAGETPLSGVTIQLLDSSGTILRSVLTDAEGQYAFDGLVPGEYAVRQVQPEGYFHGGQQAGSGGGDDSQADLIRAIPVTPDVRLIDYNFCDLPPGSLAGSVFADLDQDCEFDTGEQPIAGVSIELLDDAQNVIARTVTNANGDYRFDGLAPGTYAIREIQPVGFFHGGQRAGSGGGDDTTADLIRNIELGAGVDLVDYDFCEIPPSSISGFVFADQDEDCLYDPGERPLGNVTIELLDSDGNLIKTTRTDAQGRYRFENLTPGQYAVRQVQPDGYFHGGQRAGSGGGDDSQRDLIRDIRLSPDTDLVDYNFCELEPGSISGAVFVDLDFDCIQDANEERLPGVEVQLLSPAGTVMASMVTDSSGEYTFAGLRPGNYSVREIQPEGYFHGGQRAPSTGGDATTADLIQGIRVGSGQIITGADFCEVPPAEISGYVFQDGPVILNSDGKIPEDIRSIRDGQRTSDDRPIADVVLELRTLTGAALESSRALPGTYEGDFITVRTDADGFFSFQGLRAGSYHVYQIQPEGYADGLDTPGTTTGYAVNPGELVPASVISLIQLSDPAANPGTDAILAISVDPGQASRENNFSELIARAVEPPLPPPPTDPPPPLPEVLPPTRPTFEIERMGPGTPLQRSLLPLVVGVGHEAPPTWHLSVINGGFPRGIRDGEPVDQTTIALHTDRLDPAAWTVDGLQESTWRFVSTTPKSGQVSQRMVFDLPDAIPLAGDFNGDGYDELALFIDGEWFIDLNANGRWDDADIWLKLGDEGDQPVVGDWDGDGKDDVGVFGKRWKGDEKALAAEPGLPDSQNSWRRKPKNIPPQQSEASDTPRLLQRSRHGPARADVIDHVFEFGGSRDIAISGDFNGDGVTTLGVYRDGRWTMDVDGDGAISSAHDEKTEFGKAGDLPLVGDFDRDGIDELAILRGRQVIVDSDGNGHIDATDQVFRLDSEDGTVIVGDFDGNGFDEPAIHQPSIQRRRTAALQTQ